MKIKAKEKFQLAVGLLVLGIMFVVLANLLFFSVSLITLFAIGFSINFLNVTILSLLQRKLPNEILGRVMSFLSAVSFSLMPVSYALTGFLVSLIGVKWILVVAGTAIGLSGLRIAVIKDFD